MLFNENRVNGCQLNDWVLNLLPPTNVETILFSITWICILSGLIVCLRTPCKAIIVFLGIMFMVLIRCTVMYFVQLEPPVGIIPLRDTVLEGSFYSGKVLLKDLFFSGHTANLALLTFMVDIKWMKYLFGVLTLVVAFLLLMQHVHYTIDVLAAPFFAYFCYRLARKLALYLDEKIPANIVAK